MSLLNEGLLRPPVTQWLISKGLTPVFEVGTGSGCCDIVAAKFAPRVGRFIPAIEYMCAVELKLDDVAGVLHQARQNRYAVHFSYAAMPKSRIAKMRPGTLAGFDAEGLGLLAVGDSVEEIISASKSVIDPLSYRSKSLHRILWRRRLEWMERIKENMTSPPAPVEGGRLI